MFHSIFGIALATFAWSYIQEEMSIQYELQYSSYDISLTSFSITARVNRNYFKKAKNISNGAAEAPQSFLRKLDNGSHQRKAKQIPKMISFSLSFLRILAVSMDYAPDIRSIASRASYVRSRLFVLTKPGRQRRHIWRLNLPYMECG